MAILKGLSRSVWRVGSTTFMRRSFSSSPRSAAEAALALAEEDGKKMGTGKPDKGAITWEALDRAYAPRDRGLIFMAVMAAGTIIAGVLSFFFVREADALNRQITEVKEQITEQGKGITGVEKSVTNNTEKIAILDHKVDTLAKQLEKQFDKQDRQFEQAFARRWF